jgi:molecular chaperone DnaJ
LEQWLKQVYNPVNQMLSKILNPLQEEIDQLAGDPFDDELMEAFQEYLETSRVFLKQAQRYFSSMPNPANVAGIAANLYYCLNQLGDGLDELELFTMNYDEHYLHTGQELFRIAHGLRREAHANLKFIHS